MSRRSGTMGWLDRFYGHILSWTLRHKLVTLAASIALMVAAVYGASFLKQAFVPTTDQGSFTVGMQLPPGTSLSQTDRATSDLEARLLAYPEIKTVLATIGGHQARLRRLISMSNSRKVCGPRRLPPRHTPTWPTSRA